MRTVSGLSRRRLSSSSREAVAGPDAVPFAAGMGLAESRVWTWKDELPKAGNAWYGKFVYKRASLLSPRVLTRLASPDIDWPGPVGPAR